MKGTTQNGRDLNGVTAVITGGGSGIGEAVAHELTRHGAQCALVGRTEAKLARVARAIEQLLARYRKHSAYLSVDYVDPQRFPERARDADVDLIGQLVLDYRGRRETLYSLGESPLTNAIARLTRPSSPWVAVLEGHGERAISGAAGADIGRFAQLLNQRGFRNGHLAIQLPQLK